MSLYVSDISEFIKDLNDTVAVKVRVTSDNGASEDWDVLSYARQDFYTSLILQLSDMFSSDVSRLRYICKEKVWNTCLIYVQLSESSANTVLADSILIEDGVVYILCSVSNA